MDRPKELLELARTLAATNPAFQEVRGPGDGDRATGRFMRDLRALACTAFGEDCSEKRICGKTGFAVDFYFLAEETIVEVALGLPNSTTEFEKDILKAIIAQESGYRIRRLLFISRAGAEKKCQQPGRIAVREWARNKHQLEIAVHDLGGEPRLRRRRPRPTRRS